MNDQETVRQFIAENDLGGGPSEWIHDLQSELGEVAKEQLKATDYGDTSADYDDDIEMEIGDLYFSLLGLANSLGVDIEDALERVLQKYGNRADETGGIGSGD